MGGKRPCIPGEISPPRPRKAGGHSDVPMGDEKSAEVIVPQRGPADGRSGKDRTPLTTRETEKVTVNVETEEEAQELP